MRTLFKNARVLRMIDQSRLPDEVSILTCRSAEEVAEAIVTLKVRGAPAIGVAAAYGLALGLLDAPAAAASYDPDLVAVLHRGAHMHPARHRLHGLISGLIAAAAVDGDVRRDVPAAELAGYCVHALGAASGLASKAAVRRLVQLVSAALRPDSKRSSTRRRPGSR